MDSHICHLCLFPEVGDRCCCPIVLHTWFIFSLHLAELVPFHPTGGSVLTISVPKILKIVPVTQCFPFTSSSLTVWSKTQGTCLLSDSAELNPLLWVLLTPSMGRMGSSPSPLTAREKPLLSSNAQGGAWWDLQDFLPTWQPNKWYQTRLEAHCLQNLDLQLIFR